MKTKSLRRKKIRKKYPKKFSTMLDSSPNLVDEVTKLVGIYRHNR